MNEINKKKLREIYGLNEGNACEDSSVIRRRKYHVYAAIWLARWMYYLQLLFLIIGAVFLLFPALGLDWYPFLLGIKASYVFTKNFNLLSFFFFFLFIVTTTFYIVIGFNVKNYPGGWDPTKQFGYPSPKQVVELELYPNTKKEEFVFWMDFIFGVLISTWPLLAVSLLSFLIMR